MGVVEPNERNDIQSIFDRDPAARGTLEVVLLYPRPARTSGPTASHIGSRSVGAKFLAPAS